MPRLSKGNPVNIPEPVVGPTRQRKRTWRRPLKSWVELSFLLDSAMCLENRLTGEKAKPLAEHVTFGVSGALGMARENPREGIAFATGRTHNRSRSPRCAASS